MKLGFSILGIIVAVIFMFFDYSISLGILLALFAKEMISFVRRQLEANILHATKLESKIVIRHFFIVSLIMIITLSISFLLQDFFNPIAVGAVFILDRFIFYIKGSKVDRSN